MKFPNMKCKCKEDFDRKQHILGLQSSTETELHWYCVDCEMEGIYKIPKGYKLCLDCKSTTPKSDHRWNIHLCTHCRVGGLISWTDEVLR